MTDSEGDVFNIGGFRSHVPRQIQLDRDVPVPFKLEFPVNKDLVMPALVRLNGFVLGSGELQDASFRITSK